jgi:uridine kinase
MTIGIAGGSGSGKTTLATRLRDAVGAERLVALQQDSYYRDIDILPEALRAAGNFDHPDCIDFPLLVQQLGALRSGHTVQVPQYDFATHHRLCTTTEQRAHPVVLVEGILIFTHPALRELLDLKIFVDTDDDIRLLRRIRRDTRERGRTLESVLDQYAATVRPMHQEFVAPSQRFADLIVPEKANFDLVVELLSHKIRSLV